MDVWNGGENNRVKRPGEIKKSEKSTESREKIEGLRMSKEEMGEYLNGDSVAKWKRKWGQWEWSRGECGMVERKKRVG